MEDKNIRYNTSDYAYGAYAYDFTGVQFHTHNKTKVTKSIRLDTKGRLLIGLQIRPKKGERILIGEYKLPYLFTGEVVNDRKEGLMFCRIKKIEGYDFGLTLDKENSTEGAPVYFIDRLSGKEYLDILSKTEG